MSANQASLPCTPIETLEYEIKVSRLSNDHNLFLLSACWHLCLKKGSDFRWTLYINMGQQQLVRTRHYTLCAVGVKWDVATQWLLSHRQQNECSCVCVCVASAGRVERKNNKRRRRRKKKAATGGVGPTGSGAVSPPGFMLADHETVPLQMSCKAPRCYERKVYLSTPGVFPWGPNIVDAIESKKINALLTWKPRGRPFEKQFNPREL